MTFGGYLSGSTVSIWILQGGNINGCDGGHQYAVNKLARKQTGEDGNSKSP